jgi:hypothetical protein
MFPTHLFFSKFIPKNFYALNVTGPTEHPIPPPDTPPFVAVSVSTVK